MKILLEKLKLNTIEESPNKDKLLLFSTKDKTKKNHSKKGSFQFTDMSSPGDRQSASKQQPRKNQVKSFVLTGEKRESFEYFEVDNKNKNESRKSKIKEPNFFLSPQKKEVPTTNEIGACSQSLKIPEPSTRLQRARIINQKCKSFLGEKQSAKDEIKQDIDIIPAGLRDFLCRLKSAPAINRPSEAECKKETSNIEAAAINQVKKADDKKKESHYFNKRRSNYSINSQMAEQHAKTNQEVLNKKLNCARKLTFDELLPINAQVHSDQNNRADLIVSLSEELLKRRASKKIKSKRNLAIDAFSPKASENYNCPLSMSTNIQNANCFLLGNSARCAARRPSSKEHTERSATKKTHEKSGILQESLRQASNPFRVICSPTNRQSFTNR